MKIKPTPKPGCVLVEVDRKDERLLEQSDAAASAFALEKILVPMDFSECSRKALRYALPLARQFRSKIGLVHVMPANYFVGSEFGPVDFPVPESEWRESSEKELRAILARELGEGAGGEAFVRQGQPAHEIAACAREWDADLIVVSTHGRTGLRHVLVGSVAENVVRYAPCPVLVVREHGHEFLKADRVAEGG
jgi:nucleotide-binding universal stress UspA family protein